MSVITSIPTGTFVGSTHHNVASAVFPIGQKVTVKQDAATGVTAGYCTFIYMHFDNGSDDVAMVAKYPAQLLFGEMQSMTCDQDEAVLVGPGGICLSVLTDTYHGWFLCGGPICNGNALALSTSILDGNFTTGTSVIQNGLNYFSADGIIDGVPVTGAGIPSEGADGGWIFSDTGDTTSNIDAEFLYIWDKFAASL